MAEKNLAGQLSSPRDPKHLASLPLFQGLDDRALNDVLRTASHRSYAAEAFIFHQGDPAEHLYLLTSGEVKLSQYTPDGQQVILRYAVPGEAFAVIAVLSDASYPVTAQSVQASQVIFWDKESINRLMQRYPTVAINAIAIMAKRVREFQDRMRELATERVERRIARALLRLARQTGKKTPEGVLIDIPLSRQDLAEMTGTTLFTVSRTLRQWEEQGLVKSGREQVLIRYPHGLVTIAEDLPTKDE